MLARMENVYVALASRSMLSVSARAKCLREGCKNILKGHCALIPSAEGWAAPALQARAPQMAAELSEALSWAFDHVEDYGGNSSEVGPKPEWCCRHLSRPSLWPTCYGLQQWRGGHNA